MIDDNTAMFGQDVQSAQSPAWRKNNLQEKDEGSLARLSFLGRGDTEEGEEQQVFVLRPPECPE